MISFKSNGDFNKTFSFLDRLQKTSYLDKLNYYGRKGVEALQAATPTASGKTAESWDYEIYEGQGYTSIIWKNANVVDGVNVAVLLQYGHLSKRGGWVEGVDYINPALKPIFDEIAESAWKEVTR